MTEAQPIHETGFIKRNRPILVAFGASLAFLLGLFVVSTAQESSINASRVLIGTLSEAQRSKLILPFESDARMDWAYTPGRRPGLSLKDLDENAKKAALNLLRSSLSEAGFQKAEAIRTQLEPVLREMERGNPGRDLELYYVMFFGTPSTSEPWGWRWEGHHLSLNFTFHGGKLIASTPQFLGSNPAEVPAGPHKGQRVLAREEDLARELLLSLNDDQKKKALAGTRAPSDLLTTNQRIAAIEENLGLPYAEMTEAQRKQLRMLVEEYASVQKPNEAKARLAKIEKAGWDKLKFAWMGSEAKRQGHYYRIQGPTFLIEYDNTQNGANHIHSVWRDFKGDFGRDALADHYRTSEHHRR